MFDLISSEYGWTDSQMLDLTLRRLRISVDMITDRREENLKNDLLIAEMNAKAIVGGMPGLAWGKRAGRAIAKYANKLKFADRPKKLPQYEDIVRGFRGR